MTKRAHIKQILLSGFFVSCLLILAGCGKETYSKEKLAQSVEQICRNEYSVEVSAKVAGKTIGVYLVLDRLIGTRGGQFSFEEKASEILEDVMISIRRVTLSTDADVKFFTLIGVDKALGYELAMTRYVDDLRRVTLMNISLNDYFQRMMYRIRPSSTVLGKKRIYALFNSLGRENIETIIRQHFVDSVTIKDLSPSFFLNLLELGMKKQSKYKVLDLREKPISDDRIVYFVKVKETYTLKEGFSDTSLSVPPDFIYEYLITVNAKNFPASIEKIYPLVTLNKEKTRIWLPLPDEFEDLGDPATWKTFDFYLEDVQLTDFIAFQVAQSIRGLLSEKIKSLEAPYSHVKDVEASFIEEETPYLPEGLPQRSIFELIFTLQENAYSLPEDEKILSKPLLKISLSSLERICKNYNFTDFHGIRVLDSKKTEILNIDKSMMKTLLGK